MATAYLLVMLVDGAWQLGLVAVLILSSQLTSIVSRRRRVVLDLTSVTLRGMLRADPPAVGTRPAYRAAVELEVHVARRGVSTGTGRWHRRNGPGDAAPLSHRFRRSPHKEH